MPNLYRREFWQLSFGEKALNSAGPAPIAPVLSVPPLASSRCGFSDLFWDGVPSQNPLKGAEVPSNPKPNLVNGRQLQDNDVRSNPLATAVFFSSDANFRVVP